MVVTGKDGDIALFAQFGQGFIHPAELLHIFRIHTDADTKAGFTDPDMLRFQIAIQIKV